MLYKLDTFANVAPRIFYGWVSVNIGQKPERKAVWGGVRVGEPVDDHRGDLGVERLAYAVVQLVVADSSPVLRLRVRNRLENLENGFIGSRKYRGGYKVS